MNFLSSMSTQVLVTSGFLISLFALFLSLFLAPGAFHWFRLRAIQKKIENFKTKNFTSEFKKVFADDVKLAHLWSQYRGTLHEQRQERDGQMLLSAVRATVPAEAYFNSQYVVDNRLRTEFFKHLPGLFTGIGIIGTFWGLISGLRLFQVSVDPAAVRISLESLMHSVGDAFLVSAAAIGAAMFVTFLEKWLLASLYRRTEEIAESIDSRFKAGTGEEYLLQIVKTSEDSASQAKILKDALVGELGALLRDLTGAQIAATKEQQTHLAERMEAASRHQVESARQDNQALGVAIVESIQQSLKGPLEDIANTVKSASGDQSAGAVRMLQDVMVSFSQRLSDLFGGQISGLSALNHQTAQSVQDAVSALQALVANLEESSRRSSESMAERMAQAVERMEARQEAMNSQSQTFVEQIRELVAVSQSETSLKLQTTLEVIGSQVAGMLATLSESQKQVFEGNRDREEAMTGRAQKAVDSMSESMTSAVKEMVASSNRMAQSVSTLGQATSASVDRMNAGADKLGTASHNFAAAGDKVGAVMSQAATVSAKLIETSGAMTAGAQALQELLQDYQRQRDAVGLLVTELKATVEVARKEASLTGDILGRIQSATEGLSRAQKQADEYLTGISRVLGDAHTSFATEVKKTLDKANHEFHTKLTSAVSLLSAAISELEATLASAGTLSPTRR